MQFEQGEVTSVGSDAVSLSRWTGVVSTGARAESAGRTRRGCASVRGVARLPSSLPWFPFIDLVWVRLDLLADCRIRFDCPRRCLRRCLCLVSPSGRLAMFGDGGLLGPRLQVVALGEKVSLVAASPPWWARRGGARGAEVSLSRWAGDVSSDARAELAGLSRHGCALVRGDARLPSSGSSSAMSAQLVG